MKSYNNKSITNEKGVRNAMQCLQNKIYTVELNSKLPRNVAKSRIDIV